MKLIFVIIISCFVFMFSSSLVKKYANVSSNVVKIAIRENFSPYSYIDENGIARGYAVDEIKRVFSELNLEYEFYALPARRLFWEVFQSNYDVFLPISSRRLSDIDLDRIGPLTSTRSKYIVVSSNELEFPLEGLNSRFGRRLGIVAGGIRPELNSFATVLDEIPLSPEVMINLIRANRIDYYYEDSEVINEYLKNEDNHDIITTVFVDESPIDYFAVFSVDARWVLSVLIECEKYTKSDRELYSVGNIGLVAVSGDG